MAKKKNYYETLNVAPSATQDDIKTAYKTLAKKYHPDLNPGNKKAEEKFKAISEAYSVLSNKEKRAQYDAVGTNTPPGPQGSYGPFYSQTQSGEDSRYRDLFREAFGGFGFEDLFQGKDVIYQMSVSFADSVLGAEKEFSTPEGHHLSVKVPAGIKDGQKLRFAGKGEPGINGGPPGDLYLSIQVTPSRKFVRNGDDLEVEVPTLFSTAILGGKIRVPTVDGSVELSLPPKVSSGTKLRIKGKGVRGKPPGDLFARIKVIIPKEITPELERAVKEWHQAHGERRHEKV